MGKYPAAKHWVRVTHACNNRCLFCHDSENRAAAGTRAFEDVRRDLEAGRRLGIEAVVLSGGEATVERGLEGIVREAAALGYRRVQVITNGRMFAYDGYGAALAAAGLNEATFSFYSHDEALHDRLADVPGAFAQSLRGLANALDLDGVVVNIDILVCGANIGGLRDSVAFFHSLGVREFDLLYLIPFGRAYENRDELFMTPGEAADGVRRALEYCREAGARVWVNRMPACLAEGYEECMPSPWKVVSEVVGHAEVFDGYLSGGGLPACRGERCGFCFLEKFCDAMIVREEFRLRGGDLDVFVEISRVVNGAGGGVREGAGAWVAGAGDELFEWCGKARAAGCGELSVVVTGVDVDDEFCKRVSEFGVERVVTGTPPCDGFFEDVPDADLWLALTRENVDWVRGLGESVGGRVVFFQPSLFPEIPVSGTAVAANAVDFEVGGVCGLPECMSGGMKNIDAPDFYFGHVEGADGRMRVGELAGAFVGHVWAEKSLRCVGCAREGVCRGVAIEDVVSGRGLGRCAPVC